MTQLEDSQILDLFWARSEQAIRELDQKYGEAVRKTAQNLLRSRQDAEECVNDTYLGAWNSIPPQRPAPLVSFVCRIARNLAVSRLRRDGAQKRGRSLELVLDEMEDFLPSGADVEGEYEAKELVEAVNRFLADLDYDDRYLFVRRYWYADGVKDIAASMHRRENQVSLRLFRLRKQLRNTMKKEGLLA